MTKKTVTNKGEGITENGVRWAYEVYEDGSAFAKCAICGKWEERDAEVFAKLSKKPQWFETFTCTPCWKNPKDAARQAERGELNERISWAQSFNLAVAITAPMVERIQANDPTDTAELLKSTIAKWQEYFYAQLTAPRNTPEDTNQDERSQTNNTTTNGEATS